MYRGQVSLIKSTSKESGGKSLELKKHIGTVQISNPLSLIQRKAFTILLFNAYHDLEHGEGKVHSIPMGAFCELLGYNSNDRESLDAQI